MQEFKVFQALSETASKNDKLAILQRNDTPTLRLLLWLTYNKFITYRVSKLDLPETYNLVQPDISKELQQILMLLSEHTTGSNAAKAMIKRLLSKCTEEGAKWVVRIIQRDLNVGIDSTINKAFPGLIPEFKVQLANTVKELDDLEYPVVVEEKLDGLRTIAVCKNDKVNFYSREGFEFEGLDVLGKQILNLYPGKDFVLDGEILATKFCPYNKTFIKHKDHKWQFEGGKSMVTSGHTTPEEVLEYLGYFVWDVLDIDYFESAGKKGEVKSLATRKMELTALFEHCGFNLPNVSVVPNVIATCSKDVWAVYDKVLAQGGRVYAFTDPKGKTQTYTMPAGEGVMVKCIWAKYEFKRSNAILKLKQFYTMDLAIIGAYEGEPDTKYVGQMGGLICSDGVITTRVGSGIDDDERIEWWAEYLCGNLKGIAEVKYQDKTADNSLRIATLVSRRYDKTTINVEGM
jgi:hypothetical protein